MTVNVVPYVIQALSHPADNFRRALSFDALGQQGVRSWVTGDMLVTANGSPNMSVNVAAGQCLINGTENTVSQGSYHLLNDATVNLTIAASDPTNPRIDIVCASVQDAVYSGATNLALFQVVTGTPAPSPSPPATPKNSLVLAQVAVAANATSIVSGNITDKRVQFGSLFHAEAFLGANQNLPQGAFTQIAFDTIESDPNGNFTTGASAKYTAPVAGRYLVTAAFNLSAVSTNNTFLGVYKNAVENRRGEQIGGSNAFGGVLSAVVRAAAADALDLRAFQGTAGALTIVGTSFQTYAQFSLLGPL